MTTDTFRRSRRVTVKLGDADVTINGIAKGAGMIAPDMATMLSFVATDAPIAAAGAAGAAVEGVGETFNAVTVDSDTSTSDTLLLFATGAAAKRGAPRIDGCRGPRGWPPFRRGARTRCCKSLALQVVRDGEGARKQVEVTVTGAKSARSAKRIALSIANSPLVKTAVAGEDANWGRVVMAVGKAGEPADRDRLSIWFGDIRVALEGERDPGLFGSGDLGLHEARRDRDPRRYRPRPRQGHGLDLRPDQGICRDQRRLPELMRYAVQDSSLTPICRPCAASRRPASAPGRQPPSTMTAPGSSG